jgi:hypothetical protein
MKMKCPKCGYENKEEALYCNLCTEIFRKEKKQKPVKEKIQDCSGEFMPVRRRIKYGYLIRFFLGLLIILNILLRGSVFKNLPGQLSFIFIAIFMIFILVDIYYYFTLSCPNCNYELGKFCNFGVNGFAINPFKFFKLRFCPECSCLLVKKQKSYPKVSGMRKDFSYEYQLRSKTAKKTAIITLSLFCLLIIMGILSGVSVNGQSLLAKTGMEKNQLLYPFIAIIIILFSLLFYASYKTRCPNCNHFSLGLLFQPSSYCIKCGAKLK